MSATSLTSILIWLPVAGALLIWLLPLSRYATGSLALLFSLAEVGFWIEQAARFDFSRAGPADGGARELVRRPRRLVPRRRLRLLALARRPHRRRDGRVHRLRLLGRPRPLARLLRPDAAAHRRDRRRLRGAGPARLLRLLRGDADPALRPDRRLGRRTADGGDDQVRHLHDGRLAADARRDRRLRTPGGDVRPRGRAGEREPLALPRLHGRLRDQGAALPVPRLAAGRVPRGAAGGEPPSSPA